MENLNNKYIKWYWNICNNAKNRILPDDVYVEKHHIYPLSIYGSNDNIVILTAREHFIVHKLLWWGFRQEYGTKDQKTRSMCYAFRMMYRINSHQRGKRIVRNSDEYSFYRIASSEAWEGENNPMYGKGIYNFWVDKYGKEEADIRIKEFGNKISKSLTGKKLTAETKQKLRDSHLGKTASDETKQKLKDIHAERTPEEYSEIAHKIHNTKMKNGTLNRSEEFKEKSRIAKLGKKNPMYGKSVYSIWVDKYGKEEADMKLKEQKRKSKETKLRNKQK